MDIIKKLFAFNNDETSAIGLCKFNDNFFKALNAKEKSRKIASKNVSLSQMLRKTY